MTDPAMPHPDAMDAAFKFPRLLRDPEFRRHVTALGASACPVVCTFPGEDPARLAARVQDVLREEGKDAALVVGPDDTQPWGLRMEVCRG